MQYMVRDYGDMRGLIRVTKDKVEGFHFPGKWEEMPHLNAIRYGQGAFMDYDDVSEEEAMKVLEECKERFAKLKASGWKE